MNKPEDNNYYGINGIWIEKVYYDSPKQERVLRKTYTRAQKFIGNKILENHKYHNHTSDTVVRKAPITYKFWMFIQGGSWSNLWKFINLFVGIAMGILASPYLAKIYHHLIK